MGAGVTALGTGCLGGGGEVVLSIQQDVHIDPQGAWMETEIPDVSDPGGAIQYIVRAEQPFDVYFFTDESAFRQYDAYIKGREPDETPPGNPDFSQAALPGEDDELYEASTTDDGAREPLEATGPYFFAVDHSSYRMENRVEKYDEALTAFVDLTVIEKRVPF